MKKYLARIIILTVLGNMLVWTTGDITVRCTGLVIVCMGLLATGLRND